MTLASPQQNILSLLLKDFFIEFGESKEGQFLILKYPSSSNINISMLNYLQQRGIGLLTQMNTIDRKIGVKLFVDMIDVMNYYTLNHSDEVGHRIKSA